MSHTEQDVAIGGLRLHYYKWGDAARPAVVYVHGFTGTGVTAAPLVRALRARHVLAPDLRGHGHSEWSFEHEYQPDDYVADLEQLVATWGPRNFGLVGTSLGGLIAMRFAIKHPGLVTGLAVNDMPPEEVPEAVERMRAAATSRPTHLSLGEVTALTQRILPDATDAEVDACVAARYREEPEGWTPRWDSGLLPHRVDEFEFEPLWDRLPLIQCPTVIVWGMESGWLSEANARRMTESIPGAQLVSLPGVPHAPTLLEPAALRAVREVLG